MLALFVLWGQVAASAPLEGATLSDGAHPARVVRIAVAGDISQAGDLASSPYGQQLLRGLGLALLDRQDDLKERSIEVEIQVFDSEGDRDKILSVAESVVQSDSVAVLGHVFSSEALIAAETYGRNQILFVSPGATADRMKVMGDHVVSTVFTNLEQAKVLVRAALDGGFRKVAVVSVKDCAYCENLRILFEVEARRTELEVISVQNILSEDLNMDGLLDLEPLLQADLIFLPNYESINGRIISYLDKAGAKQKTYLGGDGWGLTSQVFRDQVQGVDFESLVMAYFSPLIQEEPGVSFSVRYEAEFGSKPLDTAVLAYDGMQRLIEIILWASAGDINRESILQSAQRITESPGALGLVRTSSWQVSRPYTLLQYRGADLVGTQVKRNVIHE